MLAQKAICAKTQHSQQRTEKDMQKKKTGCMTWIGYVFIAIVVMVCIGIFGSDEEDEPNTPMQQSEMVEENSGNGNKPNNPEEPVSFRKGEIYTKNKCIISVSNGDENGISIQIKNKSKKDYSFNIHSMSINGIMTNCNIYTATTSVPSNKKGMMNIEFEKEWLAGVESIEYVDMIIWAYDDAKDFKDFETNIIRIKTDRFKKERKFKQRKGSRMERGLVIQKEKLDEDIFEFSVINKNDYFVEFDFENSSINGWAFEDDYLFDAKDVCVYPNSKTTIEIDISEFTNKNNIRKIKNIEFSLAIRTEGDYFKEQNTKKIKFK